MFSRDRTNDRAGLAALAARARDGISIPTAWTEALVDVLAAFLIVKLGFYSAAVFGNLMVPYVARPWTPSAHMVTPTIINITYHWDGEWYYFIAMKGYDFYRSAAQYSSVAFFPLFPLLINLVGRLFPADLLPLAGVLVVNIALLGAMFYVRALALMDGSRSMARRGLWYLVIFPAAIFFQVAYSESLFLLTAAATIYHARRRQWWTAGIWALLASVTRVQGVFLAGVIGWELLRLWRQQGRMPWKSIPVLALPPLGIGLYMAYLYWQFRDPIAFVQAQAAWDRSYTFPLETLGRALAMVFAGRGAVGSTYGLETLNVLAVLLFLAVALASVWRWPAAYNIFVFSGVLVSLATPSDGRYLMSGARFMVVLFPVFFTLADWAEERPALGQAIVAISLPLFGLLAALFVAWQPVY